MALYRRFYETLHKLRFLFKVTPHDGTECRVIIYPCLFQSRLLDFKGGFVAPQFHTLFCSLIHSSDCILKCKYLKKARRTYTFLHT